MVSWDNTARTISGRSRYMYNVYIRVQCVSSYMHASHMRHFIAMQHSYFVDTCVKS